MWKTHIYFFRDAKCHKEKEMYEQMANHLLCSNQIHPWKKTNRKKQEINAEAGMSHRHWWDVGLGTSGPFPRVWGKGMNIFTCLECTGALSGSFVPLFHIPIKVVLAPSCRQIKVPVCKIHAQDPRYLSITRDVKFGYGSSLPLTPQCQE